MRKKSFKTQKAYSLAEALITMLVVTMIILMSAPMITGKKKAEARPHGVWECYLENGQHVSKRTVEGEGTTIKNEGDYCSFEPQPSTKKYSVTVVGAGGGGASGATAVNDAISYGNTVGYEIDVAGEYDVLLVGGGGGGSTQSGSSGHLGGSAGKIYVQKNKLLTPGYYVLKAGLGGKSGGSEDDTYTSYYMAARPDDYEFAEQRDELGGGGGGGGGGTGSGSSGSGSSGSGSSGSGSSGSGSSGSGSSGSGSSGSGSSGSGTGGAIDTSDMLKSCNFSGTWDDICNGGDGEKSTLQKIGGETWVIAGGYGGGKTTSTKTETGIAANDKEGCTSRAASGATGGKIFQGGNGSSTSACGQAREILGDEASKYSVFGHGGNGSYPGYNGIVIIRSSAFYAGGGGKAGGVSYMTLKEFKDPIKVYVGAGGEGGTVENTRGMAGQNTSFGNYLTAKGGDGGTIKANSSTSKTSGIAGESGSQSPYGGTLAGGSASCNATALNGTNNMDNNSGNTNATANSYGGGGGGGGAFSHRSTTCSLTQKWGKGGRGASGYVRVEWN